MVRLLFFALGNVAKSAYSDYAEEQEEDINGILEDDEVKEHAQKINMSYAEGPPPGVLRKSARERSEAIKDTIRTVVTNFQPPSPPTRSS
jgi:hypothetical protein